MGDYPKVKRLFPRVLKASELRPTEIKESVEAAAKLLGRGKDVGRLQLRLVGEGRPTSYTFDVLAGECRVAASEAEEPDLDLVVSQDTWLEIANGSLSPVDAYLTGRMEIAGDIEFAKRQYAKVMTRGSVEDLPV
jgi:putative sterol carrier protein